MEYNARIVRLFLTIFLFNILRTSNAWRNYNAVFKKTVCRIHSPKVKELDCFISLTPQNVTGFNVRIITSADLYLDHIHADANFSVGTETKHRIEHHINGCEFLEGFEKNFMLNLVLSQLRDTRISNVPKQCPLKKDTEYYIKDLHIEEDKLPPFAPQMQCEVFVEFYQKSELLLDHYMLGEFLPKVETSRKDKPKGQAKKPKKKHKT